MEMTIREKIKWLGDRLSDEYSLYQRKDIYIPALEISNEFGFDFWDVIEKFKRDGLIKDAYIGQGGVIVDGKPEAFTTLDKKAETAILEQFNGKKTKKSKISLNEAIWRIKINPDKFVVAEKEPSKKESAKSVVLNLHLNSEGDLYREPKNKYCYPMMEEKERQKILRYFIDRSKITSKYIQTQTVASDLVKDAQNIRTEIGKINRNAKNNLKLKGRLIESKQSSGYKLNPQFKITPPK